MTKSQARVLLPNRGTGCGCAPVRVPGSFRRKEKLEGYLESTRVEVARLKAEIEAAPGQAERAREAARLRAAKERQARLEKAGAIAGDRSDQEATRQEG